jgi:hypothetical protein
MAVSKNTKRLIVAIIIMALLIFIANYFNRL